MASSTIKSSDKHSVVIAGHATSVTLEPEFWAQLKRIAQLRGQSLAALIAAVDQGRGANTASSNNGRNLSASLRVYVLDFVLGERQG